jgi:DNA-binding transcriptional LysR family regulator
MTMLEWDDVRIFLAIARHGSLTAAARAVRVTQPTMGRRLEVLEDRLGVRLFDRTPTGAALTEFGNSILPDAERMELAALSLERHVAGRDTGLEGTVRVTCVDWFGVHVLAPLISGFAGQYPAIMVELAADSRVYNLARRETDIAIRFAGFDQNGVIQRRIGEIGYGLYAAGDYLERCGVPDFATGCDGHTLITMHEEANYLAEVRWLLERAAPRARIGFRSSNRDAQAKAALAGVGLAILPRCMADRRPELQRLEPKSPPPGREVWLGYHEDMRETPRIRAVANFIADAVRVRGPELNPAKP